MTSAATALSRLDVVWGFAKTQFQRRLAYPGDFWLAPLARLAIAFALIGFWNAVFDTGASPGGMTKPMMLAWAGAAVVLSRLMEVNLSEDIAERIRRGDIVFEIMRPFDFQPQMFGTWLGTTGYTLLIDTLPMSVVLFGIARIAGPAGMPALGLALLSGLLAMLTAFLLQFTVVLIGFWTIQVRTWTWMLAQIVQVAAGWFVPLWLLPDGVREGLQFLPFAMLYHVPLSIFVGRVEGGEALRMLAIQAAWLPALFLLSRWMLRQARARVLIQGG